VIPLELKQGQHSHSEMGLILGEYRMHIQLNVNGTANQLKTRISRDWRYKVERMIVDLHRVLRIEIMLVAVWSGNLLMRHWESNFFGEKPTLSESHSVIVSGISTLCFGE